MYREKPGSAKGEVTLEQGRNYHSQQSARLKLESIAALQSQRYALPDEICKKEKKE
jgi:hypothetical protein